MYSYMNFSSGKKTPTKPVCASHYLLFTHTIWIFDFLRLYRILQTFMGTICFIIHPCKIRYIHVKPWIYYLHIHCQIIILMSLSTWNAIDNIFLWFWYRPKHLLPINNLYQTCNCIFMFVLYKCNLVDPYIKLCPVHCFQQFFKISLAPLAWLFNKYQIHTVLFLHSIIS